MVGVLGPNPGYAQPHPNPHGPLPVRHLAVFSRFQAGVRGLKISEIGNHLAEVVRSKPGRPAYRGKRHSPPLFQAHVRPYLKGLNSLFNLI